MTISPDLMLALLALDSYNRGYNPAVSLPAGTTRIGPAHFDGKDSMQFGLEGIERIDQAAGFYAASYTIDQSQFNSWSGGPIVISYRGTDDRPCVALPLNRVILNLCVTV